MKNQPVDIKKYCECPDVTEIYNQYKSRSKTEIKEMICKVIDNLPNYITISDLYIKHIPGTRNAFLKIKFELTEEEFTIERQQEFTESAVDSFDSGLDYIV